MDLPTFDRENQLMQEGYQVIAGVDEAGCGALAGPVVAGAAVLSQSKLWDGIRDSKLLSPLQRERMYKYIVLEAKSWAVGQSTVEEIQKIGIRHATFLAMQRALESLPSLDFILVDAWHLPGILTPQQGIIHGDRSVFSIAAGSILAKVTRDRLMCDYAQEFPSYGFEIHKGYGTTLHRKNLQRFGPCPIHRLGWKGINKE
ncbi:MAG: Ribonuclease HII [Candidatus Uhrbacteria bacterium GW2011_GWF2_41_16]|jgi:ribonuclease HII|uniref:Ribonuclease HII n=2 Tax=Candidatus Uhriibacteriota TaxID=1752732 RepID=A0A0G0VA50_9BACT|nr:MAG: Ribonuclease HII [Candidatus Uhrbacteria bacterium GW2011_GWC2_41_11]KKR97809.1 MAG: Ribonuclease HII [Candidatus Uhrbacteria bacterium GW2011_GWF2_41_16]HBP00527.1 ribonuclease HII [Candidatus Uhrbacteria bacterium]